MQFLGNGDDVRAEQDVKQRSFYKHNPAPADYGFTGTSGGSNYMASAFVFSGTMKRIASKGPARAIGRLAAKQPLRKRPRGWGPARTLAKLPTHPHFHPVVLDLNVPAFNRNRLCQETGWDAVFRRSHQHCRCRCVRAARGAYCRRKN